MGRGAKILGCLDHDGESVLPDPMRTSSSRVAHGKGMQVAPMRAIARPQGAQIPIIKAVKQ
jgi:hypothetical protein